MRALTCRFLTACVFVIFLFTVQGSSQSGLDSNDIWKEMPADEFDFDLDIQERVSRGWFPIPFGLLLRGVDFPILFHTTRAPGIQSELLRETGSPFTERDPRKDGEDRALLPFSREEDSEFNEFQESDLRIGYLSAIAHVPFVPLMFSGSMFYQRSNDALYSETSDQEYLGLDGRLKPLREMHIAMVREHQLGLSLNAEIPVYGVFWDRNSSKYEGMEMRVSSYYYVFGGVTGLYSVNNEMSQWAQILGAHDAIRYGDGRDVQRTRRLENPNQINRMRWGLDFGIGWRFSMDEFAFGTKFFYTSMQTSVLSDALWKQAFFGCRFEFLFSN